MSLLCFNRGKFGCDVAPIVAAVIVVSSGCGLSSVIWVVFIDDEGFSKVSVVVVVVDDDVVVVVAVVVVIICDDDSLVAIVVVEVAGVIGVVVVAAAAEDVVVALDFAVDNFEFKSLE